MAQHNETGLEGEKLAGQYLQNNGYTIVATQYRYRKAEIDIVATKGNTLAFVEVKTRKNADYGTPQMFVDKKKIQLLLHAANAFIEQNNWDMEVSLDIVAITLNPQLHIEHIENAFLPF